MRSKEPYILSAACLSLEDFYIWNSECPVHMCISPLLREGLSQSQCLGLGCLESVQVWRYFVLFFLFVAGLYEEACFVRFKGRNGQFDLAWLV